MKRRWISGVLTVAMGAALLAGCGEKPAEQTGTGTGAEGGAAVEGTETASTPAAESGEVLEFYHGYYHDESEWPAAKVMRDIYDEFASAHADGPVTFKPIAVEDRDQRPDRQCSGCRRKLSGYGGLRYTASAGCDQPGACV